MGSCVLIIHPHPSSKLIQCLRELGLEVIVATSHSKKIPMVEKQVVVDIFDHKTLLRAILEVHNETKITGILPTWEGTILQCSFVAEALNLTFNSYESILASRDKLLMYQYFVKHNVPTAKTFYANDLQQAIKKARQEFGFPLILKMISSTNSQGVIKVDSLEEYHKESKKLLALLKNGNDRLSPLYQLGKSFIIQEYLDGVEVNIDLLYKGDQFLCTGLFEKEAMKGPYFPETMSSFPTRFNSEQEAEMIEVAWQSVKALGGTFGAAHVEIRYTSQGPKVIETALRPGGAYTAQGIELLSGLNVFKELGLMCTEIGYFPLQRTFKGACLYAGILADRQGIISHISGLDILKNQEEMMEYYLIKNVGDEVYLPPTSSDPHILHYLLYGNDLESILAYHHKIKSNIEVEIVDKEYKDEKVINVGPSSI